MINCRRIITPLFFTAATLLAPSVCQAQSQSVDIRPNAKKLSGQALLDDFKGRTHEGAYNFNLDDEPGNRYMESHHPTGRVTYEENGINIDGAWIIRRDGLCYVYDNPDMSGGCFRVYKVGNCFYFYSNMIPEHSGELDEDYWVARSVHKGEAPNCEPALS